MNIRLLIVLFISIILIPGCTYDKPYEQPKKIDLPSQISPETLSITPVTQAEKPKVQTFKIGESASDGRLKVIVNNVSYLDKIKNKYISPVEGSNYGSEEQYDSLFYFKPKTGYHFLILDISIENLQTDKTSAISSLLLFEISDAEGYYYDLSLNTVHLDKSWEDGDILPGMKKRGNVAFEVPKDDKGLKFMFKFDIGGQTAIFEL